MLAGMPTGYDRPLHQAVSGDFKASWRRSLQARLRCLGAVLCRIFLAVVASAAGSSLWARLARCPRRSGANGEGAPSARRRQEMPVIFNVRDVEFGYGVKVGCS